MELLILRGKGDGLYFFDYNKAEVPDDIQIERHV